MLPKEPTSDRGILKAEIGMRNFTLMRYRPTPALSPYIEHYWTIRWDLRGQAPFSQQVLSYPNVNLSFENESGRRFTGVYGVPSTVYTRHLQDTGMVLGIKFRPGGFYPLWGQPVSQITGQIIPAHQSFGASMEQLEAQMWEQNSDESMAKLAEQWLLTKLPSQTDPNTMLINEIVQAAIDNREMTQVERMAEQFDMSIRALQRLFNRYVGVSPKWVIQRFRLQEAAELMETGDVIDWITLSQQLGFFDQAHFIKTFKSLIGKSPDAYRKETQL
ncbi:AraC family transcriptional regulator [Paenibacillus cellulosilyticus]|uniref:AraC family transcriptional regulator n=1 Tax=Paenibacillus cellulosilyticus TaxID=375489 RepID=A0A2V2YVU6_9BACL|nr:helix-turn-helix transcriptional regulator [Paenibacillus cellulosilyticus]PWW05219.1 AraC family transcriptional regulator [Paenibacillus cellulosilyticus]QKS43543.1 helix-turn-helix transcriptional regulator [Paenibacillus cellulosilyticus]